MAKLTEPVWDHTRAFDREIEREVLGRPVYPDTVELENLRNDYRLLTGQPLSCDLTGDRTACAILRQWARRPWEPIHPGVLLDRMDELGKGEQEQAWVRTVGQGWCDGTQATKRLRATRTHIRLLLKEWRRMLIEQFGDFESQTDTP